MTQDDSRMTQNDFRMTQIDSRMTQNDSRMTQDDSRSVLFLYIYLKYHSKRTLLSLNFPLLPELRTHSPAAHAHNQGLS